MLWIIDPDPTRYVVVVLLWACASISLVAGLGIGRRIATSIVEAFS